MLVRPFSDIHAEFWQPNKIPRILEMVVQPLPTDKETVALVAGDIGLAAKIVWATLKLEWERVDPFDMYPARYARTLADFERIVVKTAPGGVPVLLFAQILAVATVVGDEPMLIAQGLRDVLGLIRLESELA